MSQTCDQTPLLKHQTAFQSENVQNAVLSGLWQEQAGHPAQEQLCCRCSSAGAPAQPAALAHQPAP